MAARSVCRVDRLAVLRAVRQWSAAASLVRAHRSSGGRAALLPLRGQQRRKLSRAHRLSVRRRAVHAPRPADLGMVGRVRPADRPYRSLRGDFRSLARYVARRRRRCSERRARAEQPRCAHLDGPCGRAVRSARRRHGAHLDRHRRGAAAMGGPARTLSRDLRDRVPGPADPAAQDRGSGATRLHHRPDCGADFSDYPPDPVDDRAEPRGILHHRPGVPWRIGQTPAARRAFDRVLYVDVGRRDDRRPMCRACCPAAVLVDRRISDSDRARDPVPAGICLSIRAARVDAHCLCRGACGLSGHSGDRVWFPRRGAAVQDHHRFPVGPGARGRGAAVECAAGLRVADRDQLHVVSAL